MKPDDYQLQLQLFVDRLKRAIPRNSNLPKEIGALLNKSPTTIQRKMRGEINIPLEEYLKIARTFGVAIDPAYPVAGDAIDEVSEPALAAMGTRFSRDGGLLLAQILWLSRQFNSQIRMLGGEIPWFWALNSPRLFGILASYNSPQHWADASHWAEQLQRTLTRLDWGVGHTHDEIEQLIRRLLLEVQRGTLDRTTCAEEMELIRFGIKELGHRTQSLEIEYVQKSPQHWLIQHRVSNPVIAAYCEGSLYQVYLYVDHLGLIRCQTNEYSEHLQNRLSGLLDTGLELAPENGVQWDDILKRWLQEIEWGLDRLFSSDLRS